MDLHVDLESIHVVGDHRDQSLRSCNFGPFRYKNGVKIITLFILIAILRYLKDRMLIMTKSAESQCNIRAGKWVCWTAREKNLFLDGYNRHGNDWAAVANVVGTRDRV